MTPVTLVYGACALGYATCAVGVLLHRQPRRSDVAMALACAVTAVWASVAAVYPLPQLAGNVAVAQLFAMLGWYGFVLFLYRRLVQSHRQPPRMIGIFEAVGALAAILVIAVAVAPTEIEASLRSIWIDARLAIAMVTLLILENLYRNISEEGRWHTNLFCIAIVATTLYGVVLYADAVLHRRISLPLYEGQALANLLVVPLLFFSAKRNRRWMEDRIVVSQRVVFQSATLIISGVFLIALAAAGEIFRRYGAGWGRVAEVSVIFGGLVALVVLVSSVSVRSRIRSILVDHFSARRYDYRREWMRCIQTLSGEGSYVPLHFRVIRAIADVVDSPAGTLFLIKPESTAQSANPAFEASGSWNMPEQNITVLADDPLIRKFGDGREIVVADPGDSPWLDQIPKVWLAVPLNRTAILTGFILLAPPRATFQLDAEVYELLRIVGAEVAAFIAEQRATEALVQARQFEEAGRRFAFVAHDIKNVASQLSLLLTNADRNMDNPEFRRDMITTLRGSVQKIGTMVARLQAPSAGKTLKVTTPRARVQAAVEAVAGGSRAPIVLVADSASGKVAMEESAFDAVIRHLLDNAIEASPRDRDVQIRLQHSRQAVIIEVIDEGAGMSPDFIRNQLFRPFVSSKKRGLGIGAFQARELVREAGGEIEVESAVGEGTKMRIKLPLADGALEAVAAASEEKAP